MKLRDNLALAWRSLTGHRLRSALTVVGIVVGISTVVIFASFGTSVKSDVVAEFQGTSASEIYVVTGEVGGPFDDGDGGDGGFSLDNLEEVALPAVTVHDVERLGEIEGVTAVIPRGSVDVTSITHDGETAVFDGMTATSPAAFGEGDLSAGRSFESGVRGEAVLTRAAVERFGTNLTVGDTIEVDYGGGRETLTVVGIADSARGGFGGFAGFSPDVYVPVDPYYREFGPTARSPSQGVDQVAFRQVTLVAEPNRVPEVKEAATAYLEGPSDATRILGDVGITVQSTADLVDGIQSVLNDIIRLVTGIGVLALLVGAFGIANIMLVSVTERTKEIGIMKANGARNREVMGLFLAEAVLLGVTGAVVGIPVGLAVGYGAAAYAEVGFTIPLFWVGVAAGMGLLTGVVSGLYPAWRAARVDPIDALRYE